MMTAMIAVLIATCSPAPCQPLSPAAAATILTASVPPFVLVPRRGGPTSSSTSWVTDQLPMSPSPPMSNLGRDFVHVGFGGPIIGVLNMNEVFHLKEKK